MNTQKILDTLPEQAKRSVLFSLVGSLNASVVGAAASAVSRLTKDDYEFRELEPRDVITMLNEMDDRQDFLLNARRTVRVAQGLRDQLIAISNNDEDGTLNGTIDFMTSGKSRPLDSDMLSAVLEAAGITGVDTKHFEAMNKLSAAERGARLAAQRGHIEWLIEHVFTTAHTVETDTDGLVEITDDIEDLPGEQRERVYEKLTHALNRARDNTILGVLQKDRRYTFGDLPLISAAIKDAEQLTVH